MGLIGHMNRIRSNTGRYSDWYLYHNPPFPIFQAWSGQGGLFTASGWRLNMEEDMIWSVVCTNPGPVDILIYRSTPTDNFWEIQSGFLIPAAIPGVPATPHTIENFNAQNDDQWWVAAYKDANGKFVISDGEPSGSDALLAKDENSAQFFWHKPHDFSVQVKPRGN